MTLILSGTDGLSDIDGSAATPAIRGTDTNTGIFFPAADTIAFSEGGAEAMRIDSSGNVGIGTSSPTDTNGFGRVLDIQSSTGAALYVRDSDSPTTLHAYFGFLGSNSTTYVWNKANGPMLFGTNDAERARIDSSGNFLVGTTSASTIGGIGLKINHNATSPYFATVGSDTTSSSGSYYLYSTGAAAYRFYVGYNGTIFATNTTISAISDQRLKENIRDLDVGLDAVMSLKPRKFDWKEGKGKDIKGDRGWIAQEFEQVFPDLIDEWKDPAPEGEEPYKSIRADLIPVLVKAIQEQQAIIQSLTARIEALEGK